MGAVVTNNSWGGDQYSQALADAIGVADSRGSLFVAAAGNNFADNDATPNYPSNYELPNVIAVAATTNRDARAWFSNYGAKSVDLGAPGASILSTRRGGGTTTMSGTSMASPHAGGTAALYLSSHLGATASAVETQLKVDALSTGTVSKDGQSVDLVYAGGY
jgi:subtilisin family serine protease